MYYPKIKFATAEEFIKAVESGKGVELNSVPPCFITEGIVKASYHHCAMDDWTEAWDIGEERGIFV